MSYQELQEVRLEDIAKHVNAFSNIGKLGNPLEKPEDGPQPGGFLRAGWSAEETEAIEYIKHEAESFGLITHYDKIGNLFAVTPYDKPNVVLTGSHVDTYNPGGNYDGAAGVIAGLEAVRTLHLMLRSQPESVSKDARVVIWRGEESETYGKVYKGSKSAFGIASEEILDNTFKRIRLEDAIIEQGRILGQDFNCDLIRQGRPALSQEFIDSISALVELHIEQANSLEVEGCDIGNVTSVRGPVRYKVVVQGEFNHSGATPMGKEYRKDANLAIAYMQVRLNQIKDTYIAEGHDLVQTVGELNTNPDINKLYPQLLSNGLTSVSGFGYFTLDIRSNDDKSKLDYASKALDIIRETAKKFNVNVEISKLTSSKALPKTSEEIQGAINDSCKELGYSCKRMPSGAGHDFAVVGRQQHSDDSFIQVGGIFIPCRNGKSHSVEEYACNHAITKGANVLARTMYSLMK